MNPERVCGVCGLMEESQGPLAPLIALLPDPADYLRDAGKGYEHFDATLNTAANNALPALREAANNCPACIFAAIRQSGIPLSIVEDFDWTKEMEAVWTEFNDSRREADYREDCRITCDD